MIVETSRLILREMTDDDFDALYRVLADSDIMQHYPYTFDEARVRNWIARNRERYRIFGFGLWAVILKETGTFIGDCGISLQPINGQWLPEVGYHINKAYWRQGYASEAAAACIRLAFERFQYPAVYSYMNAANEPSWRTAMKNGMSLVTEYVDDHHGPLKVFSIDQSAWKKQCSR